MIKIRDDDLTSAFQNEAVMTANWEKRKDMSEQIPISIQKRTLEAAFCFSFLKDKERTKGKRKHLALSLGCLCFIVCLQDCPESLIPFHHNTRSNHFVFKGQSVATHGVGEKKHQKRAYILTTSGGLY